MADTTSVKTVSNITRRRNSPDGNPTWQITFTDGLWWVTAQDSTLGYEVTHSWEGRTFRVTVNGQGRIVSMVEGVK